MGYRIVYGEDPFEKPRQEKSHLRVLTAGFMLALIVLVRCCWPRGTELLRLALLPRENHVTAAFADLTAEIQAGEPVGDAVTAFCRSVVEGAVGQTD